MQYSPGLLFDERYLFQKFLGSGSFGEVWLAKDQGTDLDVAIKIYISMDSAGLSEFRKEFQLSFELNHTNLLHANYLGVSVEDNRPYLVMPFCPEGSVSKYAGKMTEKKMWRFIRDVAAGLAFLHDQKPPIIHQDIKPDNILILKNGNYVISDFGISKQLKSSMRKSAHLNSAGAVAYMGPERFSKQYHAVKASDIWSLGVTIYELIMDDLPFCGMGGSMQKQGADIPDLPEEFSKDMHIIYTSCLAKETWDRPSAAQIRDYADACLKGKKPEITWNYQPEEAAVEATPASEPASAPVEQPTSIQASEPEKKTDSTTSAATEPKDNENTKKSLSKSDSSKVNLAKTVSLGNVKNNVNDANNEELPPVIGDVVDDFNPVRTATSSSTDIAWWWFLIVAVLGFAGGILIKFVL